MKRIVSRILGGAIVLLALTYACDYASVRFRREPFGTVTVTKVYAIRLKNNRIQYMDDQPEDVACVNSLFPHSGRTPCWYLSRHLRQQVRVDSGNAPL
jgi:hypothetical protein